MFVSLVVCPQGGSRLTSGLDGGEDREDDERELHFEVLVLKVRYKRVDEAVLILWTDRLERPYQPGLIYLSVRDAALSPGWKGVSGGMF